MFIVDIYTAMGEDKIIHSTAKLKADTLQYLTSKAESTEKRSMVKLILQAKEFYRQDFRK